MTKEIVLLDKHGGLSTFDSLYVWRVDDYYSIQMNEKLSFVLLSSLESLGEL